MRRFVVFAGIKTQRN